MELLIVYMMLFGKHANICIRIMQGEREAKKKKINKTTAMSVALLPQAMDFKTLTHLLVRSHALFLPVDPLVVTVVI